MTVSEDHSARMLTALVRLHGALRETRLPLEVDGVDEQRAEHHRLVQQLEDHVIPRQMSAEAPLLVVVGGSTGAGKSTLVNTLVGRRVTAPGLLRPTTRSPVLVHHPEDAHWFGQDRVLPELSRVDHQTDDQRSVQLVADASVPVGLAIVDAPDVDSVEERNRALASELLAAADLWLFVTSAARYSDQVPWQHLRSAAERGAAVAVVLDRTPADAVPTVAAHLARMLASRGLKDSPLFTVHEAPVSDEGLLPADSVADIRGWLASLAADPGARTLVVRQTLDGSIRTLARHAYDVADAAGEQAETAAALRDAARTAYDEAGARLLQQASDGTVVRGEVLARWEELIGTGELLTGLDRRVGRLRDRVVSAVRGTPQQAERVTMAVEAALEALVLEHAEHAAARAAGDWEQSSAGRALLAADDGLRRAAPAVRRRAEAQARAWHDEVLDLVRGSDARAGARLLAYGQQGLGVALMVQALTRRAGGPAGSVGLGRTLLEAVFGAGAVPGMVEQATDALGSRLRTVLDDDRDRYVALVDEGTVPPDGAEVLRAAARRVDDRRFEQVRGADGSPSPTDP